MVEMKESGRSAKTLGALAFQQKNLWINGKITMLNGKIHYKSPFSMVMLNYYRVSNLLTFSRRVLN